MAVEFRDYYQVLEVPKTASADEIKKAFRKLARKYHPDVAKDKRVAENKFKEINEANEVLSDPDKRRKYDELGANWNHPEREAAQPQGEPLDLDKSNDEIVEATRSYFSNEPEFGSIEEFYRRRAEHTGDPGRR